MSAQELKEIILFIYSIDIDIDSIDEEECYQHSPFNTLSSTHSFIRESQCMFHHFIGGSIFKV